MLELPKEALKVGVLASTINVTCHVRIVMVDRGHMHSTWTVHPDILKLWVEEQKDPYRPPGLQKSWCCHVDTTRAGLMVSKAGMR